MSYLSYSHTEEHCATFNKKEDALEWLKNVTKVMSDRGLTVFRETLELHNRCYYANVAGEMKVINE